MYETRQDPNARPTIRDGWDNQLVEATRVNGTAVTITSATVTADKGATVVNDDIEPGGKAVRFRLDVSAVPLGTEVTATVNVTMSNGDTDVHHRVIRVAKT